MSYAAVYLEGDETGQELLAQALRFLEPSVIGFQVELIGFDLSLANRRRTNNAVVHQAAQALTKVGYGIKAATITPEGRDDVGSPNAILRREVGGTVIVRTGRRLPGIRSMAGVYAPITVVRMAVGDAYGAREWREGEGIEERAFRQERIDRRICRHVARFAFDYASRHRAKVFGGPKFTVSPVYEGMLKEEMDLAASLNPEVGYEPHLIDATYALLLSTSGEALVVPSLNRDGDCLSDLVMQMFGSIAAAESVLIGLDDSSRVTVAMTEAPHGTAPTLRGKDIANPLAMILAAASLLGYMPGSAPPAASKAIHEASMEAIADGLRTNDLQGHAGTTEFADEVLRRTMAKLKPAPRAQG